MIDWLVGFVLHFLAGVVVALALVGVLVIALRVSADPAPREET